VKVQGDASCAYIQFQSKEIEMASFNKITIVGYLGRDPELRYTPQGTALCKLSVATTERRKNAAGYPEEHTTWFRITVWGRQAELANEYLSKGRQVYIEGRLRLEEYTDREGNPRISPEVNATDIHFLGSREDSAPLASQPSDNAEHSQVEDDETEQHPPAKSGKKSSKRSASKEPVSAPVSRPDDDIPF
jgi:single-strand DNA-binding protein